MSPYIPRELNGRQATWNIRGDSFLATNCSSLQKFPPPLPERRPLFSPPLCPATAKHFVISNNACRLNREIIERRKLPVETSVDESFGRAGGGENKRKKRSQRRWISLTRRTFNCESFVIAGISLIFQIVSHDFVAEFSDL